MITTTNSHLLYVSKVQGKIIKLVIFSTQKALQILDFMFSVFTCQSESVNKTFLS